MACFRGHTMVCGQLTLQWGIETLTGRESMAPLPLDFNSAQVTARTATSRSSPLVKKVMACISPWGTQGAVQAKAIAEMVPTPAIHQLQRGRLALGNSCTSSPVWPDSNWRGESLPSTRTAQTMVKMLTMNDAK